MKSQIHLLLLGVLALAGIQTVLCKDRDGDVRLRDGPNRYVGRVEIYHGGKWGTICDDGWDNNAARVVCKQLGFSAGGSIERAEFGAGLGPIHLSDVLCSGNEKKLTSCSFPKWGATHCQHSEDASVECYL